MSDALNIEEKGNALVIKFIRPEIRNPLSISILDQIDQLVDQFRFEKTARSLIFTGAEDVFASGADLREIANIDQNAAREFSLRGQSLMTKIASLPQTSIAAINGYCFGGALDLALACDLRIAAPDATFCHPGVGLGIITGWGGTQRLPRLVGEAMALEIFLTAKRITTGEALRIGLINEVAVDVLRQSLAK